MARLAILFFLAAASGCSVPPNQPYELAGTSAERVTGVSRVIEANTDIPSNIIDARLIELQIGDDQLGPADYRSFVWMKVLPENIAKWKFVLATPLGDFPPYDLPPSKPNWWLSKNLYDKSTKYNPYALFNRPGWIVIQDDGNIFAMTYTQ